MFLHIAKIVSDFHVFGEARNKACQPNCDASFDSDIVAPPAIPSNAATCMGHENLILLFQTGPTTLQKRGGEGDQGETRIH